MKCPLRNIKVTLASTQQSIYTEDCLQEECAWWDRQSGRCGVLGLVAQLALLRLDLKDVTKGLALIRPPAK